MYLYSIASVSFSNLHFYLFTKSRSIPILSCNRLHEIGFLITAHYSLSLKINEPIDRFPLKAANSTWVMLNVIHNFLIAYFLNQFKFDKAGPTHQEKISQINTKKITFWYSKIIMKRYSPSCCASNHWGELINGIFNSKLFVFFSFFLHLYFQADLSMTVWFRTCLMKEKL